MKVLVLGLVLASAFTFMNASATKTGPQEQARAYILKSESEWAESVASGKTEDVQRILAEDFVGVDPEGGRYDKAKMLSMTPDGPKVFVSNLPNDMTVRFYGDAAVAQGSESWVKRDGQRGKFVWTDTWIKRKGQWQIVAAEDLIVLER